MAHSLKSLGSMTSPPAEVCHSLSVAVRTVHSQALQRPSLELQSSSQNHPNVKISFTLKGGGPPASSQFLGVHRAKSSCSCVCPLD